VRGARPLFVSQDARRTGEALFLLSFLRWLADRRAVGEPRPEVLLWHGGPLEPELRTVADVRLLDDLDRWWATRLLRRVGARSLARGLQSGRLRVWMWRRRRRSVVFCNGFDCARLLAWLPATRPRTVTQVHGGGDGPGVASASDRATVLARTDRFLVASDAAETEMVEVGVAPERIARHGYFVDVPEAPVDVAAVRARMGIPEQAVVVASTGTSDWWSAPDLFPVVAWHLDRAAPDCPPHYLWLSDADERALWPFWHDVRNVGLEDRFHVAVPSADGDELAAADVLVLTAADAGAEVQLLDARALGVPVVCAAAATEQPEAAEGVTVVPYLDLPELVDTVLRVVGPSGARPRRTAWQEVREQVEAEAPSLAAELGLAR